MTDATQVEEALAGYAVTRRALVERLNPIITAHLRRETARNGTIPGHDIGDLLLEVWIELCRDDGRLLRNPVEARSLEHHVGVVARRTALKRRRSHIGSLRGAPIPSDRVTPVAPERRARAESLRRHLRRALPTQGFLVFEMVYGDGARPSQVAAALAIDPAVVEEWLTQIHELTTEFTLAGST